MPRHTRIARYYFLAAALLFPAAGCGGGWHPVAPDEASQLSRQQQVRVWSRGRAHQLHGLRATPDSISGAPFLQPVTCDSCRIGFARDEVDSLFAGDPTGGFWGSAGLVVGGLLVGGLLFCMVGHEDCIPDR